MIGLGVKRNIMEKKYLLMFGILILLALPLISSQTYKKGEIIDLKIPFEVNGSTASAIATCNVSIDYPNGTYLKENVSMTNRNNGDFNITLTTSEINQLGEYEWRAFCCDASSCAAGYGSFEVTGSGNKLSTGESIIYFLFLGALIFVFLLSLYGSAKIPFKNQRGDDGKIFKINDLKYIKIFLIVWSYLLLMWIFGITRAITANYLFMEDFYRIFNVLYWVLLSFMFPIIVCSLIIALALYLNEIKLKTALERNVPLR